MKILLRSTQALILLCVGVYFILGAFVLNLDGTQDGLGRTLYLKGKIPFLEHGVTNPFWAALDIAIIIATYWSIKYLNTKCQALNN